MRHTGQMRILVVEDEVRLAASVQRGLQAEGFDVDVCHDGVDGFWHAQEGSYAAIVLDIMLPGRNGYVVCRDLRAAGNWTPILMLTAKDGELDEAEALDLGADDFLRKPFSHVVLVARLRAMIRRGSASRPEAHSVGDLTLDPVGRTVSRGDSTIELTAREFALTEMLMRRSPDVLSKTDILDEVWGIDFDGDPNIVEVYVGYLRRKLDRPFDRNSLRTVRGAGYHLVADQ